MVRKINFWLVLFILFNVGVSGAVTYHVLYRNFAQTITARHTFNPAVQSAAPFLIGQSAAEIEVVDLHAEKMSHLAATPTQCAAGQGMDGVDVNGNAVTCTTLTIDATNGIWQFPNAAVTRFCIFPGSGSSYDQYGDSCSIVGTATLTVNGPLDGEGVTLSHSRATSAQEFGLNMAGVAYRTGRAHRAQWNMGFNELSARRFHMGFSSSATGTAQMASDDPVADYAMFRASYPTDTSYQCMTKDGATQSIGDTGVTIDTSLHTFEIRLNAATTQALFYIDGTLKCTNTLRIPGSVAAINMEFYVYGRNLTSPNAATGMRLGYSLVESTPY